MTGADATGLLAAVFGVGGSNRPHYLSAADVLPRTNPAALSGFITRRVPFEHRRDAFEPGPDEVKTVLDFSH